MRCTPTSPYFDYARLFYYHITKRDTTIIIAHTIIPHRRPHCMLVAGCFYSTHVLTLRVSVCVSACVLVATWALQKRLNQFRCCLGSRLACTRESTIRRWGTFASSADCDCLACGASPPRIFPVPHYFSNPVSSIPFPPRRRFLSP